MTKSDTTEPKNSQTDESFISVSSPSKSRIKKEKVKLTVNSDSEASFDECPNKDLSSMSIERRQTARQKKSVKYNLNNDTESSDEELKFEPNIAKDKGKEKILDDNIASWPSSNSESELEESKLDVKKQKQVKKTEVKIKVGGSKRKIGELSGEEIVKKKVNNKKNTTKKTKKTQKEVDSDSDFSIDN